MYTKKGSISGAFSIIMLVPQDQSLAVLEVVQCLLFRRGRLQNEVIQYRLEHEYGAKCTYENFPVHKACWVQPNDPKSDEFKEFRRIKQKFLAHDKYGQLVFLADSDFTIQMTQSKYPNVKLFFTSEFE